jgi:signal transduction histidine kinase
MAGMSTLEPAPRANEARPCGDNFAAEAARDTASSDRRYLLTLVTLAVENARLRSRLTAATRALKDLRKRVAMAADQERRRIERDLHDGVQGHLVAVQIQLQLVEELAEKDPRALRPGLAEASELLQAAIDQTRNLVQGVYPTTLRDLGFASALTAAAHEMPVEVTIQADLQRRFTPEVENAVYFCSVEALQNVAKHCGPGARVHVILSDRSGALDFVLADNGPGFDPELAPTTHGLSGMRDRLEVIGGELAISSSPDSGTTINGHVPAAPLTPVCVAPVID